MLADERESRRRGLVKRFIVDIPDDKGGDVLTRRRTVAAQLAIVPTQVHVQHGAVARQHAVIKFRYRNGPVFAFHQPLARQPCSVELAGTVEAPVFRDAEPRVIHTLRTGVGVSRA